MPIEPNGGVEMPLGQVPLDRRHGALLAWVLTAGQVAGRGAHKSAERPGFPRDAGACMPVVVSGETAGDNALQCEAGRAHGRRVAPSPRHNRRRVPAATRVAVGVRL